jgi:hypothetical protein
MAVTPARSNPTTPTTRYDWISAEYGARCEAARLSLINEDPEAEGSIYVYDFQLDVLVARCRFDSEVVEAIERLRALLHELLHEPTPEEIAQVEAQLSSASPRPRGTSYRLLARSARSDSVREAGET